MTTNTLKMIDYLNLIQRYIFTQKIEFKQKNIDITYFHCVAWDI